MLNRNEFIDQVTGLLKEKLQLITLPSDVMNKAAIQGIVAELASTIELVSTPLNLALQELANKNIYSLTEYLLKMLTHFHSNSFLQIVTHDDLQKLIKRHADIIINICDPTVAGLLHWQEQRPLFKNYFSLDIEDAPLELDEENYAKFKDILENELQSSHYYAAMVLADYLYKKWLCGTPIEPPHYILKLYQLVPSDELIYPQVQHKVAELAYAIYNMQSAKLKRQEVAHYHHLIIDASIKGGNKRVMINFVHDLTRSNASLQSKITALKKQLPGDEMRMFRPKLEAKNITDDSIGYSLK